MYNRLHVLFMHTAGSRHTYVSSESATQMNTNEKDKGFLAVYVLPPYRNTWYRPALLDYVVQRRAHHGDHNNSEDDHLQAGKCNNALET